jgi:uncharacterized RDD family membrane protein YckC
MAQIEITTAHKVNITCELASPGLRIAGWVVDVALLWMVAWLGSNVIFGLLPQYIPNIFFVTIVPVVTFYTLVMEMFFKGQTVGKMAFGTRVIRINGKPPTPIDLITRWVFRLVDIWGSMGAVALILISSSDKNQRLGDLLSNTTVIRSRSIGAGSIHTLMKLHTHRNQEPTYPQAIGMTEEEMLRVKELLVRLTKHRNESHLKAIDIASDRISQRLDIPLKPYSSLFETNPIIRDDERNERVEFLHTLLKDYVILTR